GPTRVRTPAPGETRTYADSVPILRADLALRRTDTLGQIARPEGRTSARTPDGGATITLWTIDPRRTLANWAVLSDGSLALVRGHDYHVDWVRSNGVTSSAPKMPFDWKRLNGDDKQRIVDSTRAQLEMAIANGTIVDQLDAVEVLRMPPGGAPSGPPPGADAARTGRGGGGGGGRGGNPLAGMTLLPPDVIALDKIADYYPPL